MRNDIGQAIGLVSSPSAPGSDADADADADADVDADAAGSEVGVGRTAGTGQETVAGNSSDIRRAGSAVTAVSPVSAARCRPATGSAERAR